MKKFLYVLVCLLLIASIGGFAYLLKGAGKDKPKDTFVSTEQSEERVDHSEEDDGDSSVEDEPMKETVVKGLTVPENEEELIAKGLTMRKGATLDFTEGERAIRITCDITQELYDEVKTDENKTLGMLLIPQKFFDQVNTGKYTYIDWINAFNEAGITSYQYLVYDDDIIGDTDTGKYMRYRLWGLSYTAIVHNITCIGVLATTNADGSVTYQYAAMPKGETCQSNSRSIAYVAAESLNNHALGLEEYDDAQLAKLRGYINETVDVLNGLSAATDDGSTFEIAFAEETQSLTIGESLDLSVTVKPGLELPNSTIPIVFESLNTDAVTVDDQGKITALQSGTAVVRAYVAGEVAAITIRVS